MTITLQLTPAELAILQSALFARAGTAIRALCLLITGALKADFIARPAPIFITELEAVVALLTQTTGTCLDAAQG